MGQPSVLPKLPSYSEREVLFTPCTEGTSETSTAQESRTKTRGDRQRQMTDRAPAAEVRPKTTLPSGGNRPKGLDVRWAKEVQGGQDGQPSSTGITSVDKPAAASPPRFIVRTFPVPQEEPEKEVQLLQLPPTPEEQLLASGDNPSLKNDEVVNLLVGHAPTIRSRIDMTLK